MTLPLNYSTRTIDTVQNEKLAKALHRLTERQQRAIELAFWEEYQYKEIAEMLTAAKSCTTVPARTLKRGKTTLFAPLQGLKGKRFALRILSALLFWNRVYLHT